MTKLTLLRTAGLALALVALLASPALAHDHTGAHHGHDLPGDDVEDATAFDHMVRGIDVLPTREAMEDRFPDARDRLIHLAQDTDATLFRRWRSTSLLGNFADPEVEEALLGLTDDSEARIRAMAYYVLGQAFLEEGDDELFAQLKAGLDDETSRVRADVVRSFGWTDNTDAHQLLATIASDHEDEALQQIARSSLQRIRN